MIGLDADAGIADRDAQAGAEAAGADVDAAAGMIELMLVRLTHTNAEAY
ncbi:hypothetical protein [Ferrovibrio xuzhouensis]|uniref:Uncharacterized protein n=1 Tax=Ferrovibrio xuzhouensis TaxID=1576914 RepID=A0ABV7VET7_9PROT